MTHDSQDPNEIAEELLDKIDGDELVLYLDDDTELPVSIRRPLHLPKSVNENVEGGSLRYAVEANEEAIEQFDLPDREGMIAGEEVDDGSWNRSRVEFREVVSDDGDDAKEFGELTWSRDIKAVDA